MFRNMLLDGSVLWSMCFGREPRRCKPCRRCCRRRVSAARQRRRRCHGHAAALGLLLLLPLLGIVVAAPGAAAVLLAPLFLASAIRCRLLHVAMWQWQAHCWRRVYDCNALTVCQKSFPRAYSFFHAQWISRTLLVEAALWQAVESLHIWHPLWRQEVGVQI